MTVIILAAALVAPIWLTAALMSIPWNAAPAALLTRFRYGPQAPMWLAARVCRAITAQRSSGMLAPAFTTVYACFAFHPSAFAVAEAQREEIERECCRLVGRMTLGLIHTPKVIVSVQPDPNVGIGCAAIPVISISPPGGRRPEAPTAIHTRAPTHRHEVAPSEAPTAVRGSQASEQRCEARHATRNRDGARAQPTTRLLRTTAIERGYELYEAAVGEGMWTVGRSPECDLRLAEATVPRRAFVLHVAHDGVWAHKCSDAVRLNRRAAREQERIGDGDVLQLGPNSFLRIEMCGRVQD